MRAHGKGALLRLCGIVLLAILIAPGCDSRHSPGQAASNGGTAGVQQPSAEQRAAEEYERRKAAERAQAAADEAAFQAALSAHGKGDYQTALAGFSQLASKGHAQATSNLAVMVLRGQGRASDPQEAFRLFSKAASDGVPHAIANAGLMQVMGVGTNFDPESGAAFVRKALASTELEAAVRSEVTQRVQAICTDATQGLGNIPSSIDLAMKHMPMKTVVCGGIVIANSKDGEEAGKNFIACVLAGCLVEEASEKSSCRILSEESEKADAQRKRFTRTIRALGCSA